MRKGPFFLTLAALSALPAASAAWPAEPAAHAEARPPSTLVLTGELTRKDYENYRLVPFDVPEGARRIAIDFSYGGKEQRSVIDLGLMDPERFRGWSGGARDGMVLSTEDASPGYLAGPLPAGRWNLMLGAPNIREGARAPFEATITIETAPGIVEFAQAPINPNPGWYRGDLHMHSGNSDAKCPSQMGENLSCPAFRTVQAAAARGLDFMALTEHNTTSHFDELRRMQPGFDTMLLVPGREITTFFGHANVFGTTDFVDFRTLSPSYAAARNWIDPVNRAGGLVSINHAGAPSGEVCMGCGWRIADLPRGAVAAMEAINGGTTRETGEPDSALQGLSMWQDYLNKGWHLTGIGGSDNHNALLPPSTPGSVGWPTTVVYMPELSVKGLLQGIRAGRVFIDTQGTGERMLDLIGTSGTQQAHMGETLYLAPGQSARFAVELRGVPSATAQLIVDGEIDPERRQGVAADGILSFRPWTSDGGRHWVRVDVRDDQGFLLLLGNPVYIEPRP